MFVTSLQWQPHATEQESAAQKRFAMEPSPTASQAYKKTAEPFLEPDFCLSNTPFPLSSFNSLKISSPSIPVTSPNVLTLQQEESHQSAIGRRPLSTPGFSAFQSVAKSSVIQANMSFNESSYSPSDVRRTSTFYAPYSIISPADKSVPVSASVMTKPSMASVPITTMSSMSRWSTLQTVQSMPYTPSIPSLSSVPIKSSSSKASKLQMSSILSMPPKSKLPSRTSVHSISSMLPDKAQPKSSEQSTSLIGIPQPAVHQKPLAFSISSMLMTTSDTSMQQSLPPKRSLSEYKSPKSTVEQTSSDHSMSSTSTVLSEPAMLHMPLTCPVSSTSPGKLVGRMPLDQSISRLPSCLTESLQHTSLGHQYTPTSPFKLSMNRMPLDPIHHMPVKYSMTPSDQQMYQLYFDQHKSLMSITPLAPVQRMPSKYSFTNPDVFIHQMAPEHTTILSESEIDRMPNHSNLTLGRISTKHSEMPSGSAIKRTPVDNSISLSESTIHYISPENSMNPLNSSIYSMAQKDTTVSTDSRKRPLQQDNTTMSEFTIHPMLRESDLRMQQIPPQQYFTNPSDSTSYRIPSEDSTMSLEHSKMHGLPQKYSTIPSDSMRYRISTGHSTVPSEIQMYRTQHDRFMVPSESAVYQIRSPTTLVHQESTKNYKDKSESVLQQIQSEAKIHRKPPERISMPPVTSLYRMTREHTTISTESAMSSTSPGYPPTLTFPSESTNPYVPAEESTTLLPKTLLVSEERLRPEYTMAPMSTRPLVTSIYSAPLEQSMPSTSTVVPIYRSLQKDFITPLQQPQLKEKNMIALAQTMYQRLEEQYRMPSELSLNPVSQETETTSPHQTVQDQPLSLSPEVKQTSQEQYLPSISTQPLIERMSLHQFRAPASKLLSETSTQLNWVQLENSSLSGTFVPSRLSTSMMPDQQVSSDQSMQIVHKMLPKLSMPTESLRQISASEHVLQPAVKQMSTNHMCESRINQMSSNRQVRLDHRQVGSFVQLVQPNQNMLPMSRVALEALNNQFVPLDNETHQIHSGLMPESIASHRSMPSISESSSYASMHRMAHNQFMPAESHIHKMYVDQNIQPTTTILKPSKLQRILTQTLPSVSTTTPILLTPSVTFELAGQQRQIENSITSTPSNLGSPNTLNVHTSHITSDSQSVKSVNNTNDIAFVKSSLNPTMTLAASMPITSFTSSVSTESSEQCVTSMSRMSPAYPITSTSTMLFSHWMSSMQPVLQLPKAQTHLQMTEVQRMQLAQHTPTMTTADMALVSNLEHLSKPSLVLMESKKLPVSIPPIQTISSEISMASVPESNLQPLVTPFESLLPSMQQIEQAKTAFFIQNMSTKPSLKSMAHMPSTQSLVQTSTTQQSLTSIAVMPSMAPMSSGPIITLLPQVQPMLLDIPFVSQDQVRAQLPISLKSVVSSESLVPDLHAMSSDPLVHTTITTMKPESGISTMPATPVLQAPSISEATLLHTYKTKMQGQADPMITERQSVCKTPQHPTNYENKLTSEAIPDGSTKKQYFESTVRLASLNQESNGIIATTPQRTASDIQQPLNCFNQLSNKPQTNCNSTFKLCNKMGNVASIEIQSNTIIEPSLMDCEDTESQQPNFNNLTTLLSTAEATNNKQFQKSNCTACVQNDANTYVSQNVNSTSENTFIPSNAERSQTSLKNDALDALLKEQSKQTIIYQNNNTSNKNMLLTLQQQNPQIAADGTSDLNMQPSKQIITTKYTRRNVKNSVNLKESTSSNAVAIKRHYNYDADDFETLIKENQIYGNKIVVKEKLQSTSEHQEVNLQNANKSIHSERKNVSMSGNLFLNNNEFLTNDTMSDSSDSLSNSSDCLKKSYKSFCIENPPMESNKNDTLNGSKNNDGVVEMSKKRCHQLRQTESKVIESATHSNTNEICYHTSIPKIVEENKSSKEGSNPTEPNVPQLNEVSTLDLYEKRKRIRRIKDRSLRDIQKCESKRPPSEENEDGIINSKNINTEINKGLADAKLNIESECMDVESDYEDNEDNDDLETFLTTLNSTKTEHTDNKKVEFLANFMLCTQDTCKDILWNKRERIISADRVAAAYIAAGRLDRLTNEHSPREPSTEPSTDFLENVAYVDLNENDIDLQTKQMFLSKLDLKNVTPQDRQGNEKIWQRIIEERKRSDNGNNYDPLLKTPTEGPRGRNDGVAINTNCDLRILNQIKNSVTENNKLIKRRLHQSCQDKGDSIKVLTEKNFSELDRLSKMADRSVRHFSGRRTRKGGRRPGFDRGVIQKQVPVPEIIDLTSESAPVPIQNTTPVSISAPPSDSIPKAIDRTQNSRATPGSDTTQNSIQYSVPDFIPQPSNLNARVNYPNINIPSIPKIISLKTTSNQCTTSTTTTTQATSMDEPQSSAAGVDEMFSGPADKARDISCQTENQSWPGIEELLGMYNAFERARRSEATELNRRVTALKVRTAQMSRGAASEAECARALLAEKQSLARDERLLRESIDKLFGAIDAVTNYF